MRQLTLGSLQYSRVHFSYLQVERQTASREEISLSLSLSLIDTHAHTIHSLTNSLSYSVEVKKSAMERELSEILERVNVIRRSLERANETMRGVSSLISSIDLDAIMAEINQTLSNTMDNLNYVTANGECLNEQCCVIPTPELVICISHVITEIKDVCTSIIS